MHAQSTADKSVWRSWGWLIAILTGLLIPPLLTFPMAFGVPDAEWVLVLPMYETLKFDALYYCPAVDCEDTVRGIGGGTTRIGKWILLDE